jgi:hypothetical protein
VIVESVAGSTGADYKSANLSFGTMTPLHAPDISPLFKADAVNIAVSALRPAANTSVRRGLSLVKREH